MDARPTRRQMTLVAFLQAQNCSNYPASWRHRGTTQDFLTAEYYQRIARTLEAGKFHMAFFDDRLAMPDRYGSDHAHTVEYGIRATKMDPLIVLMTMAAVTTRLGLASTCSTTYFEPFDVARRFATLDLMTDGRAAWNVVTSLNHNQAANYGEEFLPVDERYDRAHEFIEVCRKLWDSWEPDAVVMDREAGIFADPAKVHRIEHVGRFFKSRGPLNVVRTPQRGPAIVQAGTSAKGRTFAARYADAIFAIQPNIAGAKAYYEDIKRGTVGEGRQPEACKILFGIQPILGRTAEEAREKQELHNSLVPLEGGLAILSGHLDFDLSKLSLDELMAHRTEPQLQRMQTRYRTLTGELLTLREVAQRHGQSVGLLQVVGTPTQVADQMEDYFERVGGDGFMLSPIYNPGAIEEFVDLVVPELQRRGRFRRDYTGTTQRDHLMQEDP